ncbi:hypothetical protein [Bacillus sp. 1NLA3E]|uniref:hypothetical protein n=1 Tax=Bacillus sp. 1NLA3E TaxID=666686 RepID=UPI0005A29653|nr:hypothetical protein [Bacillus sp. 1NLA3E]
MPKIRGDWKNGNERAVLMPKIRGDWKNGNERAVLMPKIRGDWKNGNERTAFMPKIRGFLGKKIKFVQKTTIFVKTAFLKDCCFLIGFFERKQFKKKLIGAEGARLMREQRDR